MTDANVMNVLAARGRTIEALMEGDPVAWTIVVVVVVAMVAWGFIKKRRNQG